MEESVHPLVAAAYAVVAFGVEPEDFQQHSDQELIGVQQATAELQRNLDLVKTRSASQVVRRSRRELGQAGLAAREGYRSPAECCRRSPVLPPGKRTSSWCWAGSPGRPKPPNN